MSARGRHVKRRPGKQEPRGSSWIWTAGFIALAVLLGVATVALVVTAGSKHVTPKKVRAPRVARTSATIEPDGPVCPLTGLPAPGGHVPSRPALAIKVDNYPAARPQSGLDHADIVFDEPVEGGVTRFVAVYQCSQAPLVGPIRSARLVDVGILEQLSKPLFIHMGGINPVLAALRSAAIVDDDLFSYGGIIQHDFGRVAPYSTYITTASGWGITPSDTTPPKPLFTYSTAVPSGSPATTVHIPFSVYSPAYWHYDASTGQYLLDYGSSPAMLTSGRQISTTNIVVQKVQIHLGPWLENNLGGYEVEATLTGSGPLEVFRNGVGVAGTWQRATLMNRTRLVASDGATIPLAPGRTWVELVPSNIAVSATGSPPAG